MSKPQLWKLSFTLVTLQLAGCHTMPLSDPSDDAHITLGEGGSTQLKSDGRFSRIALEGGRFYVVKDQTTVELQGIEVPTRFVLKRWDDAVRLDFDGGAVFLWEEDRVAFMNKEHRLSGAGKHVLAVDGNLMVPSQ